MQKKALLMPVFSKAPNFCTKCDPFKNCNKTIVKNFWKKSSGYACQKFASIGFLIIEQKYV